ncbi:MAG: cofC 2 [Nocardioides sp.]|nr:cofC 2 [Nocardioides sp.]
MTADWTALVVAKAPVAGLAKTRLAAGVGATRAADLAAAALLDTLAAAAGAPRRVIALTGDLDAAERADDLRAALTGWVVVPQRGEGFDERLTAAHADAGPGPVVQVGMDTPQVTADQLADVAAGLADHDAVLGRADDGGWWVLALRDPGAAEALRGVPMSTPTTHDDTLAALRAAGLDVGATVELTDVDTAADADRVAATAPHTLFSTAWLAREVASR